MGPCLVCGAAAPHGARHPEKNTTVWACQAHKGALPKPNSRDYSATEAEDRTAAMRECARVLVQKIGRERVAEIGKDALQDAFSHGLDAYFAMRLHMLEP